MKLGKTLSLALTFGLVSACGGTTATTNSTPADAPGDGSSSETVCSIANLPGGWVVVAHSRTASCPTPTYTSIDYWNTFTIVKAGSSEVVCEDSPIPAGYVKVAPRRESACVIPIFATPSYTNAYLIEKS